MVRLTTPVLWSARSAIVAISSMNPSAQLANPSPGHSFFIAGPQVGPRRRICGLNALHSPREAQVDEEDIVRLDSGAWMNDRLVNYYLWLIAASYYERGSQPSEFTFLPSDVFQNWYKDEHLLDVHKVVHTNPILSQFIAMPCNIDNHHWILLIVAYPSDLVTLSPHPPSRACALYFDSYPGAIDSRLKRVIHQKVQRLLAQLITQLPSATTKGHPVNLPAVYPKVRLSSSFIALPSLTPCPGSGAAK